MVRYFDPEVLSNFGHPIQESTCPPEDVGGLTKYLCTRMDSVWSFIHRCNFQRMWLVRYSYPLLRYLRLNKKIVNREGPRKRRLIIRMGDKMWMCRGYLSHFQYGLFTKYFHESRNNYSGLTNKNLLVQYSF